MYIDLRGSDEFWFWYDLIPLDSSNILKHQCTWQEAVLRLIALDILTTNRDSSPIGRSSDLQCTLELIHTYSEHGGPRTISAPGKSLRSPTFICVWTCLGYLGIALAKKHFFNEKCAWSSCGKGTKIQWLTKCHDHRLLWCQSIVPSIDFVGTFASVILLLLGKVCNILHCNARLAQWNASTALHTKNSTHIYTLSDIFWETWGAPHRQIHQGNANQQDLSAVWICSV